MNDEEKIELAFKKLNNGENLFITGGGGVGKSYLLNKIIQTLSERNENFAVTALTGMASLQLPQATTVHRAFGLGIKNDPSEFLSVISGRYFPLEEVKKMKVLIVDEISMMRSDLFELLNAVLCSVKGGDKPFGGLQVIFSGDFMQLPPVVKRGEDLSKTWAFESDVWDSLELNTIYLKEIKRQTDRVFQKALGMVRLGEVTKGVQKLFTQTKYNQMEEPVKLLSTNASVDQINEAHLAEVDGESMVFQSRVSGISEKMEKAIIKECTAPYLLKLKVGAKVMLLKNDPDGRFVNGSMGFFLGQGDDKTLRVELIENGEEVEVEKAVWTKRGAKGVSLAEMMQYPVRLAYAITIHKSQGMSIDQLEVDLENCFAPGMAYVALSRARTLPGLRVKNFTKHAIHCNPEARDFYLKLEKEE